ncbi:MAG: cbb3-type cytochrome c oxidase N-terminal domain-containing protein [Flavobacteriales bacterium]
MRAILLQSETASMFQPLLKDPLYTVLLTIIIVLLLCLLLLANTFKTVFKSLYPEVEKEKSDKPEKTLYDALTAYVPVEEEHSILMDHEYDGIRELDNNLPPWWVYMFYICIIFAVVYMGYYHVMAGPSSKQEYENELAEFREKKAADIKANPVKTVDENSVALLTDPSKLAQGKALFEANCQTCHGVGGKGLNGPNLSDEYWLYGGSVKDIFSTAKYGKIEKGMPSWSALGGEKLETIVSYIKHLTPAPDGKAPQGNKYTEEAATLPADTLKTDTLK